MELTFSIHQSLKFNDLGLDIIGSEGIMGNLFIRSNRSKEIKLEF